MNTENNTKISVKYKLTNEVIERLRGRFTFPDKDVRPAIQKALGVSSIDSVTRLIRENQENGKLTLTAIVEIISEQLNVNQSDILIEVQEPCTQEV